MTNLNFTELDNCFKQNDFTSIENDHKGIRFLKLRSMSRKAIMEEFCKKHNINIKDLSSKKWLQHIFNLEGITDIKINNFINLKYKQERQIRVDNQNYLVDQMNRLQFFDWGGSFGNSLEKNIVNNYIKKIQSYDKINEEIEGNLLSSLRGYTLNSWYNHWTSIIIEDLFKDHPIVLPTVGLVKKIDFFIKDIPFDLKVTYFPEQLLTKKLQINGYGNELTMLKKICRQLNIFIPADLKPKNLKLHLYNIVAEDQRKEAKEFIITLKRYKENIIAEAEKNPIELKKWFYENQGEVRFDASNRFFLVLTDKTDMTNSWKLKRNIIFLKEKINKHLDNLSMNMKNLETKFYWHKDQQTYNCKSDILFLKYGE